jgi:hypothetical protein
MPQEHPRSQSGAVCITNNIGDREARIRAYKEIQEKMKKGAPKTEDLQVYHCMANQNYSQHSREYNCISYFFVQFKTQ